VNSSSLRNPLWAAVALASLAIYILACTSFSPDDSRVAFPAFHPDSGELGVSVFDRGSGQVESVFTLSAASGLEEPSYEARVLRAQWFDDQRLIVAWPGISTEDTGLNVLTLPVGKPGTVRYWQLDEVEKADERMIRPLAVAGAHLFVASASNLVVRLDLETGQVVSRQARGEVSGLYPSGQQDHLYYVGAVPGAEGRAEFGRLEAGDFAQTPWFESTSTHMSREELVAFSPAGPVVAIAGDKDGRAALTLIRAGAAPQTLSVSGEAETLALGGLSFSHKGDAVLAAYVRTAASETNTSVGVVEIPLDGQPPKRIQLFTGPANLDSDLALYLQPAVSHDGRTLALVNTYLCAEPAADGEAQMPCALFLVELDKSPRGIRQIPLPAPRPDHPFD